MPAITPPPPSPAQGAIGASNQILVTCKVEQTSERIRFDINELVHIPVVNERWKSCYVSIGQIEPKTSDWDQIRSAPGICVIGKTSDGNFYEVAVCTTYGPWLVSHNFQFEHGRHYDRIEPAAAEVRVHGILSARRRAQAHFLENVIREVSLGRGRTFEQYCRSIVPYQLQIPLERAILNHHVLTSRPQVRKRLCQWLVVIGLSLVKVSNCSIAFELLSKDQDQLLQVFRQDHTDLFEAIPTDQRNLEFHRISLYWLLFASCGEGNVLGLRKFDPKYTASDNANMIGSLVGISGSNRFGDYDSHVMLNALSKSRVFTLNNIRMLNTVTLTHEITTSLPIGFPKGYLDLPTEALYGLGIGQLDEVRAHWSQFYRQQPSLNKPDNNTLVLLIWSSMSNGVPQALRKWAASDDGLSLRRRFLRDIQESQTTEQLALTLTAWLCLQRLLLPPPNTIRSINGCFLTDFDALLKGELLSNECTVLEHMVFSFLQYLGSLKGGYQSTCRLLDTVLDTDASALEYPNKISVQYWMYRTTKKLDHKAARAWTRWILLCMLQSSKSFLAGVSVVVLYAKPDLLNRIRKRGSPTLWYSFWAGFSSFVLYASIFGYLESSLACKSLLFSTSGEFFALFKHAHIRYSSHRPDRWFLHAFASLSFLKLIPTCFTFFMGQTELIGIGNLLAFSALIICGLQGALSQIYGLVSQPSKHDSSEIRDLEKAFDVDEESAVLDLKLGRQHLRYSSLAALHSDFDYMLYTTIRLSNLGNYKTEEMFVKLDKVRRLHGVSNALELPDESWEMVVLKSYLPVLQIKLGEMFPGCHFDPIYDPPEPNREEVVRLLIAAQNSKLHS